MGRREPKLILSAIENSRNAQLTHKTTAYLYKPKELYNAYPGNLICMGSGDLERSIRLMISAHLLGLDLVLYDNVINAEKFPGKFEYYEGGEFQRNYDNGPFPEDFIAIEKLRMRKALVILDSTIADIEGKLSTAEEIEILDHKIDLIKLMKKRERLIAALEV